ncbi:GNAT family N-acetyltransferase [Abyssicoccus albus]|uniref:GNAT family N-acetyltransferase n=1 Tax=Abyssicoccus albus TaxID=1817405 RepID=UPI00097E3479|nr:GNAT family N-acetyltransferase [Abyssicoccus albus]AQL56657.1 hypothetical protein BVH56_06870 [Abyssicoccus albus]
MNDLNIQHIDRKFYIGTESEREAELDYEVKDQTLIATHTYVSSNRRGEGIAKALVEALIEYAREHGYKIQPVCSYVVDYFEQHKDELEDVR